MTSETMLALDVVVTDRDAAPLNYSPKGVAVSFGTHHPPTATNGYVNVAFLDGHAEGKKLDPAKALAVQQPGGGWFWFPAD
jgi:prepilin-type processing-associated H-X9-DG protein